MTRKHVQFVALAVCLNVVSCIGVNNQEQIKKPNENVIISRINTAEEILTKDNFTYVFIQKRHIPCILANMSISITLPYEAKKEPTTDPTTPPKSTYEEGTEIRNATLTVPYNATTTGSTCSDVISTLKLTWKEEGDKNEDNVIEFTFINDHSSFSLFSITASIYMDEKNFLNPVEGTKKRLEYKSENDLRLFVTPVQNSLHKCTKNITQNVDKSELTISDATLIVFNSAEDISSRTEANCADETTESKTFPYVLKEENSICSSAKMSISLEIPYSTKDSGVQNGTISVASDAKASGNCGDAISKMYLIWTENVDTGSTFDSDTKENRILFTFVKNNGHAFVSSIAFEIFLDEKNFPGATGTRQSGQTSMFFDSLFTSADNGLYSCANVTVVELGSSTMNISDVLLVAFNADKDFSTKTVTDCKSQFALTEKDFRYVVSDPNLDAPCILANMSISMKIPYKKADSQMASKDISVPAKINATGVCKIPVSEMKLAWPVPNNAKMENTVTFSVSQKQNNYTSIYLITANIYLDKDTFPDAVEHDKMITGTSLFEPDLFNVPPNGLYNCTTDIHTVKLDDIEMSITDVVFVAFNTDENLNSKTVQNCDNGTESSTTTESSLTTGSSTTPTIGPTADITPEPTEKPTPRPEPDPSAKKFQYYLMDKETKVVCIVANMTISLKASYETKDSTVNTAKLNVPLDADIIGTCGDASSTMQFIWGKKENNYDAAVSENVLTLTFKKDDSKYSLDAINVILHKDEKQFPNAKNEDKTLDAFAKELNLFSTPLKKLFRCNPLTLVKVGNVDVSISDVALIAFNKETTVSWESEQNCVTNEEGTDVGVIIGAIIGCLAFIGLIAFGIIMYRKRRRTT